MGDFAQSDLVRPNGLYPDDRCYADWRYIWHSGCWPKVAVRAEEPEVACPWRRRIGRK